MTLSQPRQSPGLSAMPPWRWWVASSSASAPCCGGRRPRRRSEGRTEKRLDPRARRQGWVHGPGPQSPKSDRAGTHGWLWAGGGYDSGDDLAGAEARLAYAGERSARIQTEKSIMRAGEARQQGAQFSRNRPPLADATEPVWLTIIFIIDSGNRFKIQLIVVDTVCGLMSQ